MVLAATLDSVDRQARKARWYGPNPFGHAELANPDAPRHVEVYLFTQDYPDYDKRMEVIAFVARMNMGWDMPHLTLA